LKLAKRAIHDHILLLQSATAAREAAEKRVGELEAALARAREVLEYAVLIDDVGDSKDDDVPDDDVLADMFSSLFDKAREALAQLPPAAQVKGEEKP
jgi:hypothetical protein